MVKKSIIGIALYLLAFNANAGTAGLTGIWTGEYIWADLDSGGGCDICLDIAQPWMFDFDNGTAEIVNTIPVFGGDYIFHDTVFTDNNDGTYSGVILLDVLITSSSTHHEYYDVPINMLWDITDAGIVTTLSGTIPADSLWFPNSTMTFDGYINPVPIPAAVWLFGSGLIGLIGIARQKA